MNLFELFVKIGVDDQASGQLKKITASIGNGLKTAAKVGVAAVGTVSVASIGLSKAFIDSASSVAQYGDNIDKMSQKMGLSAKAYQEWDFIMQHSGTTMESLQAGMKTLANAVESGNGAFERLGITQEEIASMNQEELFAKTIEQLQKVENETERTYLAGQLLGRGATELGALLNTSAEDTEAMRQQVHELGGVMSDEAVKAAAAYQDSLQNLQTSFSSVQRSLTSSFLPSIISVMDGLSLIFSGDNSGIDLITQGVNDFSKNIVNVFSKIDFGGLFDKVIDIVFTFGENLVPRIKTIMSKLFDLAKEALPEFLSGLWENISKGITYIKENMPVILAELPSLITGFFENSSDMLEIGLMIIQRITESIISSLPQILASTAELISTLVKGLADNMPQLINSAVEMILLIADALTRPETLIPLLDAALSIIVALADALYLIADNEELRTTSNQIMLNLMDFLIEGIPLIVSAAWDIIVALVSALAESFITNIETMPDLIDQFVEWLTDEDRLGGIFDAGVDIITKLMAGIVATLPKIKEKIEEFFKNLFDGEGKIELGGNLSGIFGTGDVEFNASGIGKVGANAINTINDGISTVANKLGLGEVNLVFPDGTKFAEYLLPDLENVSKARGTPIVQPT